MRIEHWNAGGAHTVDSLLYDALGRRVAKQVTGRPTQWYVYDGDQIVMDVDSTGALTAEYAYLGEANLLGMRTPTDTLVALSTATNGTIVGMARARDGAEVKRYPVLNTPWSQQMADTGLVVRFKMGGQEYDQETGLYHLGARYYDPQLGRFLSEDPIGIAGGLNLYAYAGNDPVSGRDPSGLYYCTSYGTEYTITHEWPDGHKTYDVYDVWWETVCDGASGADPGDPGGGPGGGATPSSPGLSVDLAAQQADPDSTCVVRFVGVSVGFSRLLGGRLVGGGVYWTAGGGFGVYMITSKPFGFGAGVNAFYGKSPSMPAFSGPSLAWDFGFMSPMRGGRQNASGTTTLAGYGLGTPLAASIGPATVHPEALIAGGSCH